MAAGAGGGDAGAAAAAAASASNAPQAAATFATASTAVARAGRSSSEEDFGAVGGPGHLTKLVLKFTTASESDVQPSCEVRYGCARSIPPSSAFGLWLLLLLWGATMGVLQRT